MSGGDSGRVDRAERLLRAVLAERAVVTPPADLEQRVHHRVRVRVRVLAAAAAAAAVLVGAGIPVGLTLVRADAPPAAPTLAPGPEVSPPPAPSPTGPLPPDDPCLPAPGPLPPPVPVGQLPPQTGVRGSLATDRAVVDAVLVAGWQGLQAVVAQVPAKYERRTMDAGTLRLLFVERAGEGVLALLAARDVTGEWHASQWVVGRGGWFVPIGGGGGIVQDPDSQRQQGALVWGDDPLYISSQRVCGRTFGVVVAPPDATAGLASAPRIGADARPVPSPSRPLTLTGGLAVFPTESTARSKVTVSRAGAQLAARQLNSEGGTIDVNRILTDGEIARAVRDGGGTPDGSLARSVARSAAADLGLAVSDEVAGVRVAWGGPVPGGRRAVLVALILPSGAAYVDSGVTAPDGSYGGSYSGLLAAGRLDHGVLSWQHDGIVTVVAPAAERAEVVLPDGTVLPVRLHGGGGGVAVPAGVVATLVRAYRTNGRPLGQRAPGTGLLPLPAT